MTKLQDPAAVWAAIPRDKRGTWGDRISKQFRTVNYVACVLLVPAFLLALGPTFLLPLSLVSACDPYCGPAVEFGLLIPAMMVSGLATCVMVR